MTAWIDVVLVHDVQELLKIDPKIQPSLARRVTERLTNPNKFKIEVTDKPIARRLD